MENKNFSSNPMFNIQAMLKQKTKWYYKMGLILLVGLLPILLLMMFVVPNVSGSTNGFWDLINYTSGLGNISYWKIWLIYFVILGVQYGIILTLLLYLPKQIRVDSTGLPIFTSVLFGFLYLIPQWDGFLILITIFLGTIAGFFIMVITQISFVVFSYRAKLRQLGVDPSQLSKIFSAQINNFGQTKEQIDEMLKQQGIDVDELDRKFGSLFEEEDKKHQDKNNDDNLEPKSVSEYNVTVVEKEEDKLSDDNLKSK